MAGRASTLAGHQARPAPLRRAGLRDGDVIVLGNENTGLPPAWLERWAERTVYIPMSANIRSYNLANAAAIVLAHASLRVGL